MQGERAQEMFQYARLKHGEQIVVTNVEVDQLNNTQFDFYINGSWNAFSNVTTLNGTLLDDQAFLR